MITICKVFFAIIFAITIFFTEVCYGITNRFDKMVTLDGKEYFTVHVKHKYKNGIKIFHSNGIINLHIDNLSDPVRTNLGYLTFHGQQEKEFNELCQFYQNKIQIVSNQIIDVESKIEDLHNYFLENDNEISNLQNTIKRHFSPWDSSHRKLSELIKMCAHDRKSYEHISTKFVYIDTNYILVHTRFRGKNILGAYVINEVVAKIGINNESDIEIIEEGAGPFDLYEVRNHKFGRTQRDINADKLREYNVLIIELRDTLHEYNKNLNELSITNIPHNINNLSENKIDHIVDNHGIKTKNAKHGYIPLRCPFCQGTGRGIQPYQQKLICNRCKGGNRNCTYCKGSGFRYESPATPSCHRCNGLGKIK